MTTTAVDQHISVTSGVAGGKPRIAGRRLTVQDIVIWHERLGKSIDEIASEFDLNHADVHAALVYYFDHREQIEADMMSGDDFVRDLAARTPSRVKERLQALGD